jgi:GMP synthase-like glutamine amidotransferase
MRPVVAVRHHQPHDLGIAGEALEEAGIPTTYLDAWDRPTWPEPDRISGLIVLGGQMNADQIARYPFLGRERSFLRESVAEDVPVLGICLGAQLLARAFDASVVSAPVLELGFRTIRLTEEGAGDPVLAPFDRTPVFQWHQDTFEIPNGAVRLAVGDEVPNQAFQLGRTCYAVQFHPEATLDGIHAWADRWDAEIREVGRTPQGLLAEAEDHLPAQQAAGRTAFRAFSALVLERG